MTTITTAATYVNNATNRAKLGVDLLPEYASGDRSLPLLVHDSAAGRFVFAAGEHARGHLTWSATANDWVAL